MSMRNEHIPAAGDPRGFTLVETLVAIAILMIAIVGPYYSIQQAILASYVARDQLIASSLAEEGAEYLYFMRDTNYLAGRSWLSGFDSCLTNLHPYGCIVDPAAASVNYCSSAGCPALKLNADHLYTQTGAGTTTRFTRTVAVERVSSTQVKATVTVTWKTGHHDRSVTVTENLYDWL